jgi:adenylate kinase family enzyme
MQETQKKFFIIIGRSGCGKGTQAALLKEVLEKQGAGKVLHITTGGGFRKFGESNSYSANLSKEVNNSGGLSPEFLAVWNWSNIFIENLEGGETVILDGAPRRIMEVEPLHSAIHFYGYANHATVIYLDVSESFALARIAERGREDDNVLEKAKRKMEWFEQDILPILDTYSRDPRYRYIHVKGEQSIEDVHKEIIEKLGMAS